MLLADAGSATAKDIALNGGMSLIDGTFITAMLSGITGILGVVGTIIWKSRRDQKRSRPLDSNDLFVTCQQCAEHRKAIDKRIDEIGPALGRIFTKLDDNNKRSEERSLKWHARIDPLIEAVAANKAEVAMLKDFAHYCTVGGPNK